MNDRNILITGGAGHIGSVLARAFLARGCEVALVDRSDESLARVAAEFDDEQRDRAVLIPADLADAGAPVAIAEAVKPWDKLDVIVHAAAFVGTTELEGWVVPFEEQSVETWEAAMKVNLTAVFAITQKLYPLLRKSASASVIHISSIYGVVGPDFGLYEGIDGMGNPAAYAASKGGMDQLTRWMAATLAPQIRVNGLNLGGIFRSQDARFVERYCKKVPMGRMGREEDIVGPVMFLAGPESAYVTGQNLAVDGGYTII